jgi:hypothetical protein
VTKETLGPVRVINCAALTFLLAIVPRGLDRWLTTNTLYRAVSFLGEHSLQVFSWHILVTYSCWLLATQVTAATSGRQIVLVTAVVATLFLPAWAQAWYRARRAGFKGAMPLRARPVPGEGRITVRMTGGRSILRS